MLDLAQPQYIPYIASDAKATVANASVGDSQTTVTLSGFPDDFEKNVEVPEGMTYSDGKITWTNAQPGSYTVTVSDAKNKYASVSTTFVLSTDTAVAGYNDTNKSLVKATDASDTAFANYLKNITSVKIGETTYNVSGKDAVKIIKDDGSIDENVKVNGEALFADGQKRTLVISATGYPALSVEYTPTYTYAYAAVPYDEYWQSEGVTLSGSDLKASSDVADRTQTSKDGTVIEEHDKGAFDAVSRATTNHGLHRGSFQQSVVVHTADNKDYHPVSWKDADNFVDADGKTYNKKEIGITSYDITGIKYVPVKVSASDFADFCSKYAVTKNGETLAGGYSENNLKAYTATAAVDADTNGLKAVTKGRGGYTFGKRQTGTGSGIQGQSQKTADAGIAAAAKDYSGNFGEMLRVDLDNTKDNTKYYGDLGSHMQTVVWKYYGNGEDVLATYGTKFAADNWMHKTMGIQLGLTDSLRAKLPAGHDGTGKWTITVYALGYSDTTYEVNVTADNLPKKVELMTEEQRKKLESLRDEANTLLGAAADQNNLTPKEAELKKHYDEIVALLAKSGANTEEAKELIDEVPGLIKAVEDERKSTPTENKRVAAEATVTTTGENIVSGSYQAKIVVEFDAAGKVVKITDNGTEPGKKNSGYWEDALAMFDKLIGKTKDEVDDIDAVSEATVSSNAIKAAVKDALSK